jgi:DNA polymerase/3'-5' exonuclease PolX
MDLQADQMKLEEGKRIAEAFVDRIRNQCHQIEIVGSIRRGRPEVRDIDIVCIPKNPRTFLCGLRATLRGPQIIRFEEQGAKIDLYLATPETFEVIRLIRTGSAEHNVKLATIAKRRGWQLKFGEGLVTPEGTVTTERGILEKVLGRYIPPVERE